MPRRATRTYAAIEQSFQNLELRESKTRSFFRPFDEQELERLQEGATFSTSSRHRYADVLQWNDDITALMGVDDPTAAEGIRRRQARATSALMRSRSHGAGGSARPNSAPPGFDPAPVGSALQAALQGVVDSARARSSAPHASRGFESRLIDEYLRAQSLQPSSSGVAGEQPAAGPGPGGVQEADVSGLPHINEGVEDVEEGMDGEELSSDALLMYYGSRRPRRSSAASPRRSSSPASSSWYSSAGARPASAAPSGGNGGASSSSTGHHQARPRGGARPASASCSGRSQLHHLYQQQQQQQQQRQSRPASALPAASRLHRPLSATAPAARHMPAAAPPRPLHATQPMQAWSHRPSSAAGLQGRGSTPLDVQGNCLQLGARGPAAAPKGLGPSNGFVTRDPAGPPVATHRAVRPMSARSSSSSSSGGGGGREGAAGHRSPAGVGTGPHVAAAAGGLDEGREQTVLSVVASLAGAYRAAGGDQGTESVGRHGDVRSMMASQLARQAAMTRAAALSGL